MRVQTSLLLFASLKMKEPLAVNDLKSHEFSQYLWLNVILKKIFHLRCFLFFLKSHDFVEVTGVFMQIVYTDPL